jgi:hypothetical protein
VFKVVSIKESSSADKLARMVAEKLDLAEIEVETDLNLAGQMVQRDVKGIL